MKYSNRILTMVLVAFGFALVGCDKTKPYDVTIPPPEVHFEGSKTKLYDASVNPTPVYKVNVGTTDVAGSDRTATYKITSFTAVPGVDFNIASGNASGTVTIKANEALATIDIQAVGSQYNSLPRRDTLMITLDQPSLKPAGFLDTVYVVILGPQACDEGNPVLASILGDYNNTNETLGGGPYGPYTTTITSATLTSATTADVIVENIFDNGWDPLTFSLDWSDPINPKTTMGTNLSIGGSDAGDLNATYAGTPIAIRQNATIGNGAYNICGSTKFTLNTQLGVAGVGWFNATTALYRIILER